jgi:cytoskeletal protein CcmA (bactofilin family)
MVENSKLDTLPKSISDEGKQVFLNTEKNIGDSPNKMVIGSGTSFKGSNIQTDAIEIYGKVETSVAAKIIFVGSSAEIIGSVTCDQIEIHGSVSGAIQTNGKVTIKKTATVIGTLRYKTLSIDEGANIYSDLHCTNTDQKTLDKVAQLKKVMKSAEPVKGLDSKITFNGTATQQSSGEPKKEEPKKRSFFSKS